MRSCGYAYMAQIKKKGIFGIEMGGMTQRERGNFPEKKISEGMGLEARDFSEKNFFGKIKITLLPQLRLAPLAFRG